MDELLKLIHSLCADGALTPRIETSVKDKDGTVTETYIANRNDGVGIQSITVTFQPVED